MLDSLGPFSADVLGARFAAYTQWAEHLAQGLNEVSLGTLLPVLDRFPSADIRNKQTYGSVEADDMLRPALLRKIIEIRYAGLSSH